MKDCRKCFSSRLLEKAREDKDIIVVTTDARGSATLTDFANELPNQFIECGIAEQNAVGISSGLAKCGKKVVCCGPACFYVARSLEQVKVDVAYSRIPVKIFGVSGGVAYGALGATHHSLHDIAVLNTFPGMNIVIPSDGNITEALVDKLIDYPEPVYVRVGRGQSPEVYPEGKASFEFGKANLLLEGSDLSIIATGETVWHAYKAGTILSDRGIRARVLDCSSIKPIDTEAIVKAAKETGLIITVEEHSVNGGLGSIVTGILSENPVPVKILGIPDEDSIHGKQKEIFSYYGIDYDGIVRTAEEFIRVKAENNYEKLCNIC